MIRLKYHAPGTPPATLVAPETDTPQPTVITLFQYDKESVFEGRYDTVEELLHRYDPNKINWINIDGLSNIAVLRQVSEHFKLHALALEDVLNTAQRPKAERYDDHFFIVTEMIYSSEDHDITLEQVSMFLGNNFVITIQEECQHDVFEQIRNRLRQGRGYARKLGADYLAYALLDSIVDQFFPVLESVGDSIEDLEEKLLDHPSKELLRKLYSVKRLLLQLRRASWPQREIFSALVRDDTGLITKETQVFMRDCYDHTTQIIDILESFRDLAAGLMDVYLSSLGFRTNEIMRVLTVISSIFIPLTFIAGLYGMNFNTASPYNMPELNYRYGYPAVLILMAVIGLGMMIFFKRKKWF